MKKYSFPQFIVVDLFCGAGGTTTGFANTNGLAKVIACVNHDANAIKSHWLNNPDVKHFNEDIRTLDLTGLVALVTRFRKLYPNAKLILWASLECTNFSKAKGGLPRDADSRTLADHLLRYIIALSPEIIQIENVVEFMAWGPLDKNGKPVSRQNGRDWMRWRKEICDIGYYDEWKQLNAADFGAYTSRNRLFGMFAKEQKVIAWPEPTHFKNPSTGNMFDVPKKWKPVREVLDFSDEGNSIFNRKKDLSPKTYERIYAGLVKYIAGGDDTFIAKYYSGRPEGKVISIDGPAGALRCSDSHSVVKCFLAKYYGQGGQLNSIDEPASVIPTKDRISKIQTVWIDRNFNNGGGYQSIDQPAGSVLGVPKLNKMTAERFIMNTNYNNVGSSVESPSPPLLASRRHHYIVNPAWGGNPGSVDAPCFTVVARQDKAPLYLVTAEAGNISIPVYDTDCESLIKIKKFMVVFGIVDIKMRMLKIIELLLIQGFRADTKLFGTQTEQKKFIGNAVHPKVPEAWTYAINNNILKFAA